MPTPNSPVTTDAPLETGAFWYHHRREIAIGLILLLLAAVGWSVYRFYASKRNDDAATQLASATSTQDYAKVISEFNGTAAGASACVLLADKQRIEGKFAEANKTLQDFIDKNPQNELVPAAKMGMASNLESLKKADEALALYQQISATYPQSYTAPLALISQVPLLKEKRQPEAARRACETVVSQYGDSFWAGEAMRELRTLKPVAASTPPPASPMGTLPMRPPALPAPSNAPSPK